MKDITTNQMTYSEYINSDEWKSKAARIRQQRGNRCEFCGVKAGFAVLHCHHMTYDRLGNEKDTDLLVLCERDHDRYHSVYSSYKMPKMPESQLKAHVFEVIRKGKAFDIAKKPVKKPKNRRACLSKAQRRANQEANMLGQARKMLRKQGKTEEQIALLLRCSHQPKLDKKEEDHRKLILTRRANRVVKAMRKEKNGLQLTKKEKRLLTRKHSAKTQLEIDRILKDQA